MKRPREERGASAEEQMEDFLGRAWQRRRKLIIGVGFALLALIAVGLVLAAITGRN
jgi:hypothetical protein